MALFIMGDTHYGSYTHDEDKLLNLEATADDVAIICGDAGFVWNGDDAIYGRDCLILNHLAQLPFTICFVDGNHENHNALNEYPVVEFCGGKAHKLRENIYHLMRGELFNIQGHICWAMGGAASIDAYMRTPNVSWWENEIPTNEEINKYYETILNIGKVDYIFTHQIPEDIRISAFPWTHALNDKYLCQMLNEVYTNVEFKHWYAGHWHVDKRIGKLNILYDKVIKID